MIKIVAAHIEEVRGIRKLDIRFDQATFAISGPNGSGKSGVIDAVESPRVTSNSSGCGQSNSSTREAGHDDC
mgnify:CR=1 FL=1